MAPQTLRFALVIGWIVLSSLQYGFHISALNSSQESIICGDNTSISGSLGRPSCIEMTNFWFGVITSAYTVGGFASSVLTGRLADARGRKATALYSAVLIVLGGLAVTWGSSVLVLVAGRVLIGAACGISTVLVPLYLSEVAPPAIKGNIGVLTQLSICFGILFAQSISIPLSEARTGKWRYISLCSVAVALFQIGTSPFMVETSPTKAEDSRIFDVSDEERAPLAGNEDMSDDRPPPRATPAVDEASMSLGDVYKSRDSAVQKSLWTLVLSQFFQQSSGINAVMYYSVGILTAVNPSNAKMVALFVTFVNFTMTLPAVYLIDRLGRRPLLLISLASMSLSSVVLAWSINSSHFLVASAGILAFVATFSIGLGPIPFVLMGELPPPQARSAIASAALGTNWACNWLIGLLFLPMREWIAKGRDDRSGSIFYIFAIVSAVGFVVLARRLPS